MDDANLEDVSGYISRLENGDRSAVDELLPHIYDDLRNLAKRIARGGAGQTLQPTALVHEAYARLLHGTSKGWKSRRHFMDVAAMAMRQLLTDYARAKATEKRGGHLDRVVLDSAAEAGTRDSEEIDLVALDAALTKLQALDPRQARIVELRFFSGLPIDETAELLGVSEATVNRDWRMARAWLYRAIEEEKASEA